MNTAMMYITQPVSTVNKYIDPIDMQVMMVPIDKAIFLPNCL